MSPRHGDDPEVTRRRELFTDEACRALQVDRATVSAVTDDLLRMVGVVAHGAARPAGPVAALLVGLAAGRAGELDAEGLRSRMRAVEQVLADWPEQEDER